ncbi:hypothetical protein [Chryseobacterium lathyri]|uniref:Lipid/polyisoprenoid-binding YceI-like domain-containing protein n=1 Tax=Chryseobacterium lathyri TaxID=395933 RepID=A0A511YFU8_9FLAO|nr:hypothetical protein [Chryseobacterium lathyri]GEN74059.1 hypothetical protein CLA01_41310 [Chryseobacterium lathyri]
MKIDKIKDSLAEKISNDYGTWHTVLNNTQSKNYVCNHWKVEINPRDIEIDIPNGTFSANDGFFSSNVKLGSSSDEKDIFYNKAFTAKGKFEFETKFDNASSLKIGEIDIEIEIDIF